MNNNANYQDEARERWEKTDAYREYDKKTKNYTNEKWAEVNDGLMSIFAEFGECKKNGISADSAETQSLVSKLQAYITENYYTCTEKFLLVLVKCMLLIIDSKRILIKATKEQQNL